MNSPIAILTGDLVGSTGATPARIATTMALLAETAQQISPDSRFTRHRGDGWQMALADAGDSLWACLYILARLRAEPQALSSRIAVGIGLHHPDGTGAASDDLSAAMGPAFTASGRALDAMERGQILALAGKGIDRFRKLTFAFVEDHVARWSPEQAEAMAHMLHPDGPTQEEVARRLGITRQAVGARLKAAGYMILDQAHLAFFEAPTLPDIPPPAPILPETERAR